ncbi:pyridoxamine 5'-phosphate oxidase family protein [Cognatitamlana onchidii]|uniref:pyridoxamine 5'-phosphate oxidase family protein n=1 Tax=Cognatitamlana onchidii TaxID=2562860 RepID=UPI0010A620D0|nr:pyridoxamine 5'-phosphate oxidase family protein [Algibacter onchidii]
MKEYTKTTLNQVKRGANRALYETKTIHNILDATFIGFVSYIHDKRAISIPMAYARIGNKLYLHGSRKNRMLLSLLENKKASMTVMVLDGLVLARSAFHHSVNYRSVTVFGELCQVDEPKKKETALKHIVNHMIPNRWETLRPMSSKEFNATLVVELTIETASAKVRSEGAIDDKSDMDLPIWAGVIPLKQVANPPVKDKHLAKDILMPEHVSSYYDLHRT